MRILSKAKIELMEKINPKIVNLPAYGIMYEKEAPEMPKLPHHAIPKNCQ